MNEHPDNLHPENNDAQEQPIVVEDYAVESSTVQSPPRESTLEHHQEPSGKKSALGPKLVAICLVCALLGGLGGGALVAGLSRSGSSSVIYEGQHNPVELTQVSTDTKGPLTLPEIYSNYADACVGISVDIVTTNIFGQTVRGAAAGSGFVISADGYIVTNYHVVEDANSITVSFVNGDSFPGTYVGGDVGNDIAVIKIAAQNLTPVILGDSDNVHVGETVATIGNPLGELTYSLSDGVVSALDRSVSFSDGSTLNMLQTNCTINTGNSGGPLFNLYGEVIGIVSAKFSSSGGGMFGSGNSGSIEGLGFAIPINDVRGMITDLIEKGYITGKPYLGVTVRTVDQAAQRYGIPAGAEVVYATPGLCAAKAGIQEGDIITAVNEVVVDSNISLIDANNQFKAGDTVTYTVYREGTLLNIPVTLDERTTEREKMHTDYAAKQEAENPGQIPPSNDPYSDSWEQDPGNQGGNGMYGFPFF